MFARSDAVAANTTAAAPVALEAATPAPAPTAELAVAAAVPEERLPNEATAAVEPSVAPLALVAPQPLAEERLPTGDLTTEPTAAAGEAVAALDAASRPGSQSLLLEAQDDGTTGAVPFSGSVDWSEGTDETGAPTLVGKASIPARNLQIDMLIRKNSDPALPASHLMEINFNVSDTFIGGSIAHLPGVLLKNEELVQGTPLQGASARVVGNTFLFALSATSEDQQTNYNLLTSRKWIDLAIIYATGRRAIITLEKDQEADALFRTVFDVWNKTPMASAN